MATDQGRRLDLVNDTRLNVASLLQEPVGSSREISFRLGSLPLDAELAARDIEGSARLTRLRDAVLVAAQARGVAALDCVRCLESYEQPFAAEFAEEFHQTVDVHSGRDLERLGASAPAVANEEPGFGIDENHELDFAEALRQWIVLELPMRPDCGPGCAGPDLSRAGGEEAIDGRLAALAALLPDEDRDRS